jgi:hypothetical protein
MGLFGNISLSEELMNRLGFVRVRRAGRIPNSYTPAEWRNTTPVDSSTNRIGVGFNMHDGAVLRITLSQESARHLAETLRSYLMRIHP